MDAKIEEKVGLDDLVDFINGSESDDCNEIDLIGRNNNIVIAKAKQVKKMKNVDKIEKLKNSVTCILTPFCEDESFADIKLEEFKNSLRINSIKADQVFLFFN